MSGIPYLLTYLLTYTYFSVLLYADYIILLVLSVLLCPYRYFYLEDVMVNLEELKIQLCFYSRFLIILLPNHISSCDAQCLSSLFLNEFTGVSVTTEKGRLFHAFVILILNEYFLIKSSYESHSGVSCSR